MKPLTEPQLEAIGEPFRKGMPNYPSPFTLHPRARDLRPQNSPAVQDSADDHHQVDARADDACRDGRTDCPITWPHRHIHADSGWWYRTR